MRVYPVLVIQVDMVGSQTAQRTFSLNADGRGLAVQQIDRLAVLDALSCNAEFCCQHNLITNGRKSFAQQFFIGFAITAVSKNVHPKSTAWRSSLTMSFLGAGLP